LQNNPTSLLVVAVALARNGGQWLMHCRPAGKHHAGLWEFPGGKVEADESPRIALIRESEEELGIRLAQSDLVPCAFADGGTAANGQEIVILLYTATRWRGEPRALEGGKLGWFTAAEIVELRKPPLDQVLARQMASICRQ
jgi:8-oxo-dGTP diphosphatase